LAPRVECQRGVQAGPSASSEPSTTPASGRRFMRR
jgi:hypothetical protein